ncbi:hypothetical protein AGMMS49928_29330 [Spirochaetia bacterium]|nr:hypothetical protein AGMMS49928_29330 [Spirochaetia bacterium]
MGINPNFPPYADYKTAVVDYAMKNSKSTSWYYVNNTVDFNNLLSSALGEVWTGTKTARDVISANLNALKNAWQGN